jgi:hypothetical protein
LSTRTSAKLTCSDSEAIASNVIAFAGRIGAVANFGVDDHVLLLGFFLGIEADEGAQAQVTDVDPY